MSIRRFYACTDIAMQDIVVAVAYTSIEAHMRGVGLWKARRTAINWPSMGQFTNRSCRLEVD